MVVNILIAVVALGMLAWLTLSPQLRHSSAWAATMTPLASIMGSGFLVSAPLLASVAGNYAPLAMVVLLLVAWLIGSAIRFNIANAEPLFDKITVPVLGGSDHKYHHSHRLTAELGKGVEKLSHYVLACAYFISITYYIQLLSLFALQPFGIDSGFFPKTLATSLLVIISGTGFLFGLHMVEKVERYIVSLNLATILALLTGLIVFNGQAAMSGTWKLPELTIGSDPWHTLRVMMGLLVVVQGFETSRFLGSEHPAKERIKTMRWAQGIASLIYLVFLSLMLIVITPEQASSSADVTMILTLIAPVATILPMLLTVTAVGSQFTAAVADEAGCGGLLESLTKNWLNAKTAYLAIGGMTILLVWVVDVLQVISLASRAFALFYALQCAVATSIAWSENEKHPQREPAKAAGFGLLTLLSLIITICGISSE